MNSQRFQELAEHYIAMFETTNNNEHREYYKWQMAKMFRPAMEEALDGPDEELPKRLMAIKKKTENVIDNYTQPFNGLANFAKMEPGTVRQMFRDLFAASGADIKTKEKAISVFLGRSLALREKYYPDSYLYKDDLHSITAYLFLYDPDHNYLYKASHCREFADCIEFYTDWGSGSDTKLEIFYRMCDECIAEIKNSPALLKKAESRFEIDPEGMHPDTEKHILLFDMIYCCSTYNLFSGIHYVVPKSQERRLMQERKEKAAELQKQLHEANAKAAELDEALKLIDEKASAGCAAVHKTLGKGTIVSAGENRVVIRFEGKGEKELGLKQSVAGGLLAVEGLELSEEQLGLLQKESLILTQVSYAEKMMAPYAEYLD